MDTAQRLLKTSAILIAATLLLATVGFAQTPTLLAPSTLTIGNTGFNTASVTSSAAGTTEITYTVGAPNYSGDTTGAPTGWLIAPTGSTTTPSTLSFSIRTTAGLSTGSSATVTLTPTAPTGVAAVTITVSFNGTTSGGGGGGSNILTAAPSGAINLSAALNSVASANVTITTSSASAITITPSAAGSSGGTTWLSITSISTNTLSNVSGGSILTITASSIGLSSGVTYQGTVTVTPSTGTPLIITVNFTVGTSGSNGTWSVSQSSIPLSFTTGSGIFPTASVTVSTTGTSPTYNVATTSTPNSWLVLGNSSLSMNGITVGQPFTLMVGSNGNVLATGQYSGQAIIYDSDNVEQLRVTVVLTVNGGNSSGLTISPSSTLTFNTAVNGAAQSQVVSLTSTLGGSVTVSGIGAAPAWLTATGPSPASVIAGQASTFTVNVFPAGLPAGTYSSSIAVTMGSGSQSGTLTVNLVVGGGGTGTGTTAVAPTALNFSYQAGTNVGFVARQKLVVTGPAGVWSSVISNGTTWLKFSPGGGSSLPDPAVDTNTPVVSIDPTGLTVGSYSGAIDITTLGGTQRVTVSLSVVSGPILVPNPGSMIFAAQTGQANPNAQALFFSASDSSLFPLSTSAVANNSWIRLVGPTPNGVTVQVDQTGLGTGVYSGSIAVTQTGAANSPTTIPVVLVVNGGGSGGGGTLTFSQNPFAFSSVNGSIPFPTVLAVTASSATSFVGTISYNTGSGSWLTVSPLSGVTPANLSISTNPAGLAVGSYGATIAFNANGVIQSVGVTLTVTSSGGGNTGNVTVNPTSLNFSAQPGSSPAAQSIKVDSASGAAGVGFTVQVTAGSSWLSTGAIANPATPYSFTVNVNSTTLQAGTYSGNIRITPNGGTLVDIPVTLTITAPTVVSAAPTSLTFDYRAGDSLPAAKQLTVSGGGAILAFTATPLSNGNWLVVSPASGTTTAAGTTVNVSINPSGLSTGVYSGTVTVAGTGGATGSTSVGVTLNVTAPLPTLTRVTNAGSYASGSIAPGEILTLFASDPTHPIGPATAEFLALDSTGKVSTTIGGVQVLINGFLCPITFASASQVNAVVPYELKGFVNATVLVKFLGQSSNGVLVNVATTVPGLFTQNASGTGPGAILNVNNAPNGPANPATRGDTVVVYLTGEGETSPAGITGKVTTVAAPPLPLTPRPLLPVTVTIGGQAANWSFAGEAPSLVSGVMQLNVTVPTNIAAGDQFIVVSIGGNQSQPGVTVSVK